MRAKRYKVAWVSDSKEFFVLDMIEHKIINISPMCSLSRATRIAEYLNIPNKAELELKEMLYDLEQAWGKDKVNNLLKSIMDNVCAKDADS